MTILHTTHTRDGKIEDITTTQSHLDYHIQTMINKTFTTGDQPGQVIGFIMSIQLNIPIMPFTHITLPNINKKTPQNALHCFGHGRANNKTGSLNINRNIQWNKKPNSELGHKLSKMWHKYQVKMQYACFFLN